ncbi:hypothetical protein llap_20568 [Limosa lapponica baueri]|uniref:Uncharacterized protein n=1 Tax=Limosa lapponica baueri TaxID=1758121 RepID=A0A2I0T5S2_LIMLA|nr:hypothetical protein llap_20568 [Limosa lapponica baueri]
MIYSCFAEARAAQAAGDIPSNTSAGEIKQSACRGQAGQKASLNIPSTFPGATGWGMLRASRPGPPPPKPSHLSFPPPGCPTRWTPSRSSPPCHRRGC